MSLINKTLIKRHAEVLSRRQPIFKRIVETVGDLDSDIPAWRNIDDAILYAVIGQMLSNAASSSIIEGLKNIFSNSRNILIWASKTFRKKGPIYGVSQKKRKALHAWHEFSKNNKVTRQRWSAMTLEDYKNEITSIWGFGRWSADMIAIFYLARKDVWPETDAGINRAISVVFDGKNDKNVRKYINGCETVAALYLWELLNRNLLDKFKCNNIGVPIIKNSESN